jgi:hypothetical protein
MKARCRLGAAWVLGAVLAGAAIAGEAVPREIGQIFHEDPRLKGAVVRSGEPIADSAVVRTLDAGAILRLDNGWVLKMSELGAARIEEEGAGFVNVTVYAGRLSAVGSGGRLQHAGVGSRFTLPPWKGDVDPVTAETRLLAAPSSRSSSSSRRGAVSAGRPSH